MRALKENIKDAYKNKSFKKGGVHPTQVLMDWARKILSGTTLHDFHRNVKDVGILCGYEFATSKVRWRLRHLQDDLKGSIWFHK